MTNRKNFGGSAIRKWSALTQIEDDEEIEFVRNLTAQHFELTESVRAEEILQNWQTALQKIVRVIPNDYRQVIEAQKRLMATGLSVEKAETLAFTEKLAG